MEHINLMAGEQIEVEYAEEIEQSQQMSQQMQQMMQQAGPNAAQMQQNPQFMEVQKQIEQMAVAMEARKSQLISEFMSEYAAAEREVLNQIENDPLLKLKDRELDLKARDNQRREEQDENDLAMDSARLLQARDLTETKIAENDKHQKLRAAVSLAKSGISKMSTEINEG